MQTDLQEIENIVEQPTAQVKRVPFAAVSESKNIQAPGIYAKATFVRGNVRFYTKKNPVDHIAIVAMGEIIVNDGVNKQHLKAPVHYIIPAETKVECFTLSDSVFYCIHATEETDVDKLSQLY